MKVKELEQYALRLYDVRSQLRSYVYERSVEAFRSGDQARDALKTPEHIRQRQQYIRERFLKAIGGLPDNEGELRSQISGRMEGERFDIEKVVFESRPGVKATCNLYIPKGLRAPGPAILFLCGHHDEAKAHPEYQSVCQILANSGLIVLAMDPPGQGERLQYAHPQTRKSVVGAGVFEHDYAGSQCLPLGDSLARYFLHDAMRAVDYLERRPEVDPKRIGVTGNSGGGTQTAMLMMADPRIAAAAPATFIMSRESFLFAGKPQDAEQIWPGFSADGLDHEDILIHMAPRPVLVLAARYDFFPIEGTRKTVERARRFWELLGKADHLELYEDDVVHQYSERMARKAAAFFTSHLLGTAFVSEQPVQLYEQKLLYCCPSGQVHAEAAEENGKLRSLHDEIRQRAAEWTAHREAAPEADRRSSSLTWLRSIVLDRRSSCELNPRLNMIEGQVDELSIYNAIWWSQRGLFNHAFLIRNVEYSDRTLPVTVAVWDEGTSRLQEHWAWVRKTCAEGRSIMILDVTGSGAVAPHPLGTGDPLDFYEIIHKLSTDLFWLGDSIAAIRTYDVLRALEVLPNLPNLDTRQVSLYASGRQGIYALLASALSERGLELKWERAMPGIADWVQSKHYDARNIMSVIVPGILRHLDLPDLYARANAK